MVHPTRLQLMQDRQTYQIHEVLLKTGRKMTREEIEAALGTKGLMGRLCALEGAGKISCKKGFYYLPPFVEIKKPRRWDKNKKSKGD